MKADIEKVKAVAEWPISTMRKWLQRFLGFSNFCCFIKSDYSSTTAPLKRLASTYIIFIWTAEVEKAFNGLKSYFITKPILSQDKHSKQFIVEVDASNLRV